jgi:hypothetical protein
MLLIYIFLQSSTAFSGSPPCFCFRFLSLMGLFLLRVRTLDDHFNGTLNAAVAVQRHAASSVFFFLFTRCFDEDTCMSETD